MSFDNSTNQDRINIAFYDIVRKLDNDVFESHPDLIPEKPSKKEISLAVAGVAIASITGIIALKHGIEFFESAAGNFMWQMRRH